MEEHCYAMKGGSLRSQGGGDDANVIFGGEGVLSAANGHATRSMQKYEKLRLVYKFRIARSQSTIIFLATAGFS
jgi:hypothetical protein